MVRLPEILLKPLFYGLQPILMRENEHPPIDALFQNPSPNGVHQEEKKKLQNSPLHPEEPDYANLIREAGANSHIWKKYGFLQSKNHNASPISLELELHNSRNRFTLMRKNRMT
jgi:hypothetical protein